MKIKIYSGLDEIGGNIITIGEKEEIMLDFGLSYNKLNNFLNPSFYGFQTSFNDLTIYFLKRLGIIPENFNNIFFNEKIVNEKKFVLISHAHSDHSKLVKYLHPLINVFISPDTLNYFKIIDIFNYENLEDGKILNEIINFEKYKLLSIEKIPRKLNLISYFEPFKIEDYTITPFYLEHSYENTAYLIEREKRTVLYMGDYFLSETNKKTIKEIVKKKKINILISEVTYPEENNDKETLEEKIINITPKINKDAPIFVLVYPRYHRRISELVNIFEKIDIKKEKNYLLNLSNAYTMLVFDKKDTFQFNVLSHITEKLTIQKKQLIEANKKIIDYSEITNKSIVFMSPSEILNLFYINKNILDGGTVIISTASPFDIVQEIKEEYINNIAKENNMQVFRVHKSSHINLNDLDEIIDIIKPDLFIPIHTSDRNKVLNRYKNAIKDSEVNL